MIFKNLAKPGPKTFFLIIVFMLNTFSYAYSENEFIPAIKFKDADIKVVIRSISQKAVKDNNKINIIVSPEVQGLVTIDLENVSWLNALEAVLRPYDYGYEWVGENIILVDLLEKIREREAQAKERQEVELPKTRVFKLKYIDASDAQKAIEPLLSPVGRVSTLEITGQAGWEFGTDVTKRSRSKEGKVSRTKTLVVSDTSKRLAEIEALLAEIDIMPKQILIKARIMEVNRDLAKDIGLDWGTGSTGATSGNLEFVSAKKKGGADIAEMGFRGVAPSAAGFDPKTAALTQDAFKFAYRKLTGTEFELVLHALEENANANILSSPVIVTLDNQEASILVGEKYPIVKTEVSEESSQIIGGSLEEYKDIGIQLNVVPQISGEKDEFINMIIHPAVTSYTETVKVKRVDTGGVETTLVEYPIISSREAETQILIKDGETIAIGGLLKDVKVEYEIGIPFLSKIPVLGWLFKRTTKDTEKVDLVIFITASIVNPDDAITGEMIDSSHLEK